MNIEKHLKVSEFLDERGFKVHLNKLNEAAIDKVYLDLNNKSLNIELCCDFFVGEAEIIKFRQALIEYLNGFNNVNISINYVNINKDLNTLLNDYWNNIVYLISYEIPSSLAWANNLKWKLTDKCLYIYINNEVALYTLEKNSICNKIKNKLKKELNVDINVSLKLKEEEINSIDFINEKMDEEKELLKNIISNDEKIESGRKMGCSHEHKTENFIYGHKIEGEKTDIAQINSTTGLTIVEGEIFDIESREIKGGKKLYTFNVTDFTNSITVKVFMKNKGSEEFESTVTNGVYARIQGDVVFDTYSRHLVIMLKSLNVTEKPKRKDKNDEKRVELHLHTQMSSMDGISSFSSLAKRAYEWGHKAIAITDHGVVQGFPEAMDAAKNYGIKVIYGLEGYLVNDSKPIVINYKDETFLDDFVVFDIETTGLSPINDSITEIGAVKIKNGQICNRFSQLINPKVPIPEKIVQLTGISNDMVKDCPTIEEVLPKFYDFIKGSVLVAHNASFDVGFIRKNFSKQNTNITNPVLDTLGLAKGLFPKLKSYKLDVVAKHLKVSLENHHRAVDDAAATAHIFIKCIDELEQKGVSKLGDINTHFAGKKNFSKEETYHVVILVKNYIGLKNLYKIVTESHLNYFYRKPRILKSLLLKYNEGLILSSACEAGELYKAILRNRDFNEIRDIVNFYDYLEIQPIGNNKHLVRDGLVKDEEELRNINRKILNYGKKFNKPVVATGDVHFLDPQDEIYRRILMFGQGFNDADEQPPLYFKTTDEMLDEFSYLGEEIAKDVVINNTNYIADMIEDILPIPDGTFPPVIEGAEEELRDITNKKAIEIYGDPLPSIVKVRLDRELNSIIKHGYAVMYIIAKKLVWKSLSDGYLVGSRGSVGSSFVATMSGITEVNPLVPHYVCPSCKYSEFIEDGSIGSGVDLPDKICPKCGAKLNKNGHDIPFEVFLGFEGDKEPDIDLNFAGEYQPVAHKYTEEIFGVGYVFRAGTIGTIAEKTAYGFVKKYFDEKNIVIHPAEINRLVKGCTGIKRTSGQHPGGVMIVPKYKDIHDFTPIQYPADDKNSGVITTHFDYHSISGRILKLDILGHDVPSIIRMLEDITGIDPKTIRLDDKETMKLFISAEPLGITKEDINTDVGTLGIPEFGTKFVRQMLVDTKPTTFSELVRISGLSHGTDVWLNNAQDLVKNGTAKLNDVICTRDDIMLYLIHKELDKKRSFKIMEKVRKGKGLPEDDESYMREMNVPEWYINSCKKIKYMFPKAHAVAYVMMSFRIAYFKVHYPEAFYATYFTTKAADFDADLILQGKDVIINKISELEALSNDKTAKEKNLLTVLEVVLEMYCRGFNFEKVDMYKSDSDKFLIGSSGIIPPLKCLQGVGETAARNIVEERKKGKFLSVEDLMNRAKASKTVIEALKNNGCLGEIPQSNQLSLFNI